MIKSVIGLIIVLMICPCLIGMLITGLLKKDKDSILLAYVVGFCTMLAAFQVLAIPLILFHQKFHVLVYAWELIVGVISGISVFIQLKQKRMKAIILQIWYQIKQMNIILMVAFCMIIFQMAMLSYLQHIDDDDATYVATAVTAWQTDTLYQYSHNSGKFVEILPARHALAPFPIFIATIAKIIDLHPTILAHTFLPAILIGLSYCAFALIGKALFKDNWKHIGIFLLFVGVIHLFGYQSVYMPSTFLLIRIWQGKAILANVMIPLIFYFVIRRIKYRPGNVEWLLVFITVIASIMTSSMGVILIPVSLGAYLAFDILLGKKWKNIIWAGLCCTPCLAIGILYLIIK